MPTATINAAGTGTVSSITATIANNSITIGDGMTSLNVFLTGSNDGTFSITTSTGAVFLPKTTWTEVFVRDPARSTGAVTVFFAVSTGTTDLQYRVV
tara:strand:- start:2584 stop:2874 length:291 start_codon:yes stop_codon:yes gene_type:complete